MRIHYGDNRAEELRVRGGAADAPSRVALRVLLTDDSDAVDGGRGAERDRRVKRQRDRTPGALLDC
ncbi:hypothetical protein GH5_01466 [Leishmania sp. Ghana 2012 LV757]|uniref:hypothetical protein n=1 Tax=Leishmania sp. Ghana 2012 LV757 TaxID=2803181 RepID=UPI001B6C5C8F|nr:hypothetical protein GH5_01466 [Leishmania sp. Ghana 2012 LV757]